MPQDNDITEQQYTSILDYVVEQISVQYDIQIEGSDEYFGPIIVLDDGNNENPIDPIQYHIDIFAIPPGDYELVVISNTRMANPSDDPPPPNSDPYFTNEVNSGDYPTFQENVYGGQINSHIRHQMMMVII